MNISRAEQDAVRIVCGFGASHGYGNLIAHLQTAWAKMLMEEWGFDEKTAREAAIVRGYPFKMHDDLLERGEWDETGERYAEPQIFFELKE